MKSILLLAALLLSLPAFAQSAGGDASATSAAPEAKKEETLDLSRMPFDRMAIQQVVQFHMPRIQQCYEELLANSGAHLEGRVMVAFVVDHEGFVSKAAVEAKKSKVKDARIIDCVVSNVLRMRFPNPGDNRDHPIEYPFDLKVLK